MPCAIDSITIKGYKSIKNLDEFRLRKLNVLIGANGSGKSNFISFFVMLREMIEGRLQLWMNTYGGADAQLYLGPKETKEIGSIIRFDANAYEFHLEPTVDNRLVFRDERIIFTANYSQARSVNRSIGSGHFEALLKQQLTNEHNQKISGYIYDSVSNWIVYHVHDTSETAGIRRKCSIRDNEYLRADASNLAAYLYRLRTEAGDVYELIRRTIQMVAPFFRDFIFRPQKTADDELLGLEWEQMGSDFPFLPSHFSDGTLRFIALATALLQPNPPATILLDEPELGLHPYALDTLADLLIGASKRTQLIVSTQSALLLNAFEPDNVIVVDRVDGESRFRRLSGDELHVWLEQDYTLGDLWWKNVFGGGPSHE
jgi:predicted ATPase